MKIEQSRFMPSTGWETEKLGELGSAAKLVLAFGSPQLIEDAQRLSEIEHAYSNAVIVGCSTAGEITDVEVTDDSLTVTAVAPGDTRIRGATLPLGGAGGSHDAGVELARQLSGAELRHVLVLSEGLHVNGSELARGLNEALPAGTTVSGGLAGDGERFGRTLILAEGTAAPDRVTAVGLYGEKLRTSCGSLGGWDPFGPERLVTRAEGNILYELDGRSALAIYRKYLGPYEKDLPASALLFPLALRRRGDDPAVVRTILAIDDDAGTMTFAGDMPEGSYARFMKANFDRLVDGATRAAKDSFEAMDSATPELALLISCVGRKMVLKQRIEEEVEGVRRIFGPGPVLTGFYSYGEMSPFTPHSDCRLHNQTMTITAFREVQ
ncbi:MAG: FIST C-terminal domain-containing protein [Acidobacteriota bacterium]|nr:FIST C-terminal domain-containing protein [Acidobacteriota bacterium]